MNNKPKATVGLHSVRLTKLGSLFHSNGEKIWDGVMVPNPDGWKFVGVILGGDKPRLNHRFMIHSSTEYFMPSEITKIEKQKDGSLVLTTRNSVYLLEYI